jgi:hypothetical protein
MRAQAAETGMAVLDFDGVAEVWVDSIEDWKEIVSDEEFIKAVAGKFN